MQLPNVVVPKKPDYCICFLDSMSNFQGAMMKNILISEKKNFDNPRGENNWQLGYINAAET